MVVVGEGVADEEEADDNAAADERNVAVFDADVEVEVEAEVDFRRTAPFVVDVGVALVVVVVETGFDDGGTSSESSASFLIRADRRDGTAVGR